MFARKIICCEGKTELGFLRYLDTWIYDKYHTSLSAKGVVLVNAAGGNKMYSYAVKLKKLGYETCVFADNDNAKEIKAEISVAIENDIEMFLCEEGYCIERQIIMDLPWDTVEKIVNCPQNGFPNNHINLDEQFLRKIDEAIDKQAQNEIREEIIKMSIAKNKEWFKHIPGGEFLGSVFIAAYNDIDSNTKMKQNVESILKWCNII